MKKIVTAVIILALAGMGYFYWQARGAAVSTSAAVDGRLARAVAVVPGTVSEVFVKAGDTVAQGQPLFALDRSGYESALGNARERLAEIAASLPGGIIVPSPMASRAVSPGKSLDALRDEEDEARKAVEVAAHVHASASLALSREHKPGTGRQKALIARDEAAISLQRARAAYEKVSYARARKEAEDRAAASNGVVSAALAARIAEYQAQLSRVRLAEQALAGAVVHAPEGGRVLLQAVVVGARVAAGDAPVAILPDMDAVLGVTAFFAPKDAAKLAEGQECAIALPNGEFAATGRILEVLPSPDSEKDVAVRVNLDQNTATLPVAPGDAVVVTVSVGRDLPFAGNLTQR